MSSATVDPAEIRDPRGDELANLLDWQDMVGAAPGILSTKTGRLQTTYRVQCPDTAQMAPEARAWYLARLDAVLRLLEHGWALDADWWHEPDTSYPVTDWQALGGTRADQLVDSLRQVDFEQHPRHASTTCLTLSWQPPEIARQWLQDLFTTRGARQHIHRGLLAQIALFQEGATRFAGLLASLTLGVEALDAHAYSTYLHQCVSWDRHGVLCPTPATDLAWQLTSDLWQPGQPPTLGGILLQPITIKTWQRKLRTYLPEALSMMPFPCRYHVGWRPLSAEGASHFLKWEEKRWAGSYSGLGKWMKQSFEVQEATEVTGRNENDSAQDAGQSILDVKADVERGLDVVGQLSPTVLCWAPDPVTLGARVTTVREALFQQGLVARVERANASLAWLAMAPGHVRYRWRARVLKTAHLTALIPHAQIWNGPERDPHHGGPPLLVASASGAPFRLVTHVGDLGGVLLIGPSRTGKSGKFGLMIRQSYRYARQRNCLFDRDFALKPVTLLSGGKHYTPGIPGGPQLQPLAALDTLEQRQWANGWLEERLTDEGLAPEPEERREIWRMVQMLGDLPRAQRTLSMARRLLQIQRLKVGLAPFCAGGEYAFCDGSSEVLDWNTHLICFEMSALLHKPRARNAVLSYCFQQLETQWFTGDPVHVVVDEMKWPLALPTFRDEFEVWVKARAKKNVSVWGATQEPYDLQQTPAWQAVLANMPTKLFLPNPMVLSPGVRPLYVEMGVQDHALHQIAEGQAYRDYLYSSPLGTQLYQCQLSPVERLLCAASEPEELAVLDTLAAEYSPEELPAAWLRRWGYPEEAALLEPVTAQAPKEEATWSVPFSR